MEQLGASVMADTLRASPCAGSAAVTPSKKQERSQQGTLTGEAADTAGPGRRGTVWPTATEAGGIVALTRRAREDADTT